MPLYPKIEPYDQQELAVSDLHTVYFEQCGNPNGQPILFIHGGPGGGCGAMHRQFFDPEYYRIILVDQRGCGRSKPNAELRENTTQDLIDDFEIIRNLIGIDRWMLFGGSWGSTLSLAYAQAHPEVAQALILRGIFLGRKTDDDWIFSGKGAAEMFPDQWEIFKSHIPKEEQDDLFLAYYKRMTGNDPVEVQKAADIWAKFETLMSRVEVPESDLEYIGSPEALAVGKIECHYFYNKLFLEENQLLDNIDKIRHLPCVIVHGRYDVVCKLETAWALHKAWPEADLHIVPASGHSAMEPRITDKLIEVTDQFRELKFTKELA